MIAERGRLEGAIRASGIVTPDESRTADVHPRLEGWIEELHVRAIGQPIEKGEPLYSLYSQQLFLTQ